MRLALAVLAVLAVGSACGGDSEDDSAEVTLRAHSVSGGPLTKAVLDRSVSVLEDRLEDAGVDAVVERVSRRVTVRLERGSDADAVVELAMRRGVLEFYDLEANLVGASIDADGVPVAHSSLYELLVGAQSPAREDEVQSWYLFDAKRKLAGGPAPTKRLLLAGGALLDGWRVLGVPPKTVVIECGIGEVVCPGVGVLHPTSDSYYLIRHDPPEVPELDGTDLELEGTRQDYEVTTGAPIVVLQFTREGARRFEQITKREADRGRSRFGEWGGGGDPGNSFQHFAIVLDREIKSWPSIDWQHYPDGISGGYGAQISGIAELQEAKDLALVLRSGALPVRFEVVARP